MGGSEAMPGRNAARQSRTSSAYGRIVAIVIGGLSSRAQSPLTRSALRSLAMSQRLRM